jgi:hypothetical protein
MTVIFNPGYLASVMSIFFIFFGIGFSVLLFMLGIKALKALDIYIDKNQE